MNETQSTVESGGVWLTVSEAAARLKISERTVQRKCKTGKLTARLETTDTGTQWLVDGATLPTGADRVTPTFTRVPTGDAILSGGDAIGADRVPTGADTTQAVEIAKLQGYAARDMERAIGDAVTQAIAPLMAQMQTMNETNIALQREVAETRAEVIAMRADRNADQAQLAKLEELLAAVEAIKPEVLSTVDPTGASAVENDRTSNNFERENQTARIAAGGAISGDMGKVSGDAGNVAQRGAEPQRRGVLGKLIGWVNGDGR